MLVKLLESFTIDTIRYIKGESKDINENLAKDLLKAKWCELVVEEKMIKNLENKAISSENLENKKRGGKNNK